MTLTLQTLLPQLATTGVPRNEIRLLAAHALERDAAWLIQHDTDELSTAHVESIRMLIARRAAGEPVAYIVGHREFHGRRFKCTPAALIPRPETELLIETTLTALNSCARPEPIEGSSGTLKILDVGTGTGCIAITLALETPSAHITACDISRDALALAHENARALSANVTFIESDWFSAFTNHEQFDLIVSNPPYIVPNDPHLFQGDLRFEPWLALQDRGDGLQSYRELAAGAKKRLRDGGTVIVEHGYDQGESVPAIFRDAGFVDVEMIRDLAGQPRVTRCKKPPLA